MDWACVAGCVARPLGILPVASVVSCTEFFLEFIALFFPALADQIEPDSLEFLDKELFTDLATGSSHEADIIVKVRFRGREAFFIVHVENQSTPDANFGERLFLYFARIFEQYRLPIYPIMVFSYDAPRKAALRRYKVAFPDLLVLNFRYRAVQLNQLLWRTFVRNPNPVAGALMAKMRIAKKDRPKVKRACMTLSRMQKRINALAKEQLETLALALLDFTDIKQVRAWLDADA